MSGERLRRRDRGTRHVRPAGPRGGWRPRTAPIEGRIGGVVDIPNACCSVFLPTAIFDMDIRPNAQGPRKVDRGQVAMTS